MKAQKLETILKEILHSPTAPFHEYFVRDTLLRLLGRFPHVRVEQDDFGNLIAGYRRGRRRARYAFGAHMDHPGWVRGEGDGEWEFLGGVPPEYLRDPDIEEFEEFGMWRLPAMEVRDGLVYSRACDDLINCGTIVALFEELEKREVEGACYGLFTRAEEVGFVGAIHLARKWPLSKGVVFVSLETSSPAGEARMGGGPVLRVGDRLSVFDDAATRAIGETARECGIEVQRCLLDRGSCEASAFQAYGIASAGLSILLGNYHNCAPGGVIEPEYVSLRDAESLVELIVALVERGPARGSFRGELEKRVARYARHGRATRKWFRDGG